MNISYDNKIALVTGAGRGIGKQIALDLASCNATVICVSKSASCEQTAKEIIAQGGSAYAVQVDISDKEALANACSQITKTHQRVDILVNNAGITRDNLLMRMSDSQWEDVISTNLSSAFYIVKNLIRPMARNQWGRVINISSVVGIMGNAGQANYAAAKAGLIGFTKTIAREFASRQITANVICPGFIETDMTNVLSDDIKAKAKELVPLKKFGSPQDIGAMVAFLASERANYITGQVFSVDGGFSM